MFRPYLSSQRPVPARFLFAVLALLLSFTSIAQTKTVTVYGLVQGFNQKPLEAATVSVLSVSKSANGRSDTLRVNGITNADGVFSLKATPTNDMYLQISQVGHETYWEPLLYLAGTDRINAGQIVLREAVKALDNVVVTAKKPFMQLGVDRRIFNAEANINSRGGTAVDLMRNIPALSVDASGNVQLRNSTPTIFVDGRPTILTLEQIPSDDIDKVEVITNPSSKYDAGSTGGIINIVLKKNRRNGMNGTVSAGIGHPEVANGSLSINYRQGKINFFASGNYNRSGGLATSEASRINKKNGTVTDYFNQVSETDRNRRFMSARIGIDYFWDEQNAISVSQGFTDGSFKSLETQDQEYADAAGTLTKTGTRINEDEFGFNRRTTQVNYRRTYNKPGKEWTADFTYSGGNNSGFSNIANRLFNPDGSPQGNPNLVRNEGMGDGSQYTFQTDYVNPISENSKLELGVRSYHNISNDKLDVLSLANGTATKLPLSNNYGFREMVNAVYANYSNTLGTKWKYQGGLRIEQSSFEGELKDSARQFGYNYPGKGSDIWKSIFPSLYLTYAIKEGQDLQFNFTRRIRRPNFWQINPYVDITDPQNIRVGNPTLQPEFTNSFEANYNRTYEKGNILISSYFRNNTDDITQYSDTISQQALENLNNAAVSPNALLTTFINAERTNRMGLEIAWQHKFKEGFDITPSFNAQYRDVKANVNGLNLSNTGFNWDAEITANYKIIRPSSKLFNNFAFQLNAEYESPRVIPQGREKAQASMDFAIRKELLKNNAGTIIFNISDVFNSRIRGSITETDNFYQDSYRRWSVRTFRLTFSYRFGNKDLQIFKRRDGGGDGEGRE